MTEYGRTPEQRRSDYAQSKVWEHQVRQQLPDKVDDRCDSLTELDFFVPGPPPYFLECKEKNQCYGKRWHRLPGVEERDLFILDELSFRKARMAEDDHVAPAFFVLHDRPAGRVFLAGTDELSLVDRVRVNRLGPSGAAKGKLIIDLGHLNQVPLEGLHETIEVFIEHRRINWSASECLSLKEVPYA